jgi:hypothetical protein
MRKINGMVTELPVFIAPIWERVATERRPSNVPDDDLALTCTF